MSELNEKFLIQCKECGSTNVDYHILDYERTVTIYCEDCDNEVDI
jgi:uncharacterized Zn finger protein